MFRREIGRCRVAIDRKLANDVLALVSAFIDKNWLMGTKGVLCGCPRPPPPLPSPPSLSANDVRWLGGKSVLGNT